MPDLLHPSRLASVGTADDPEQLDSIRAWLQRTEPGALVSDFIEATTSDERLLTCAAERTIEHVNGFDRITLVNALPHYRLRLHIWWPERRGTPEDIHNHAWDFGSALLCGQLRFKTYILDPTGEEHWLYRHRYGQPSAYRGGDVERVQLRCVFDTSMPAGTIYTFDHDQIHRVIPEGDAPVATLVVAGALRRDGSDVYTQQPRHHDGFRQPATSVTPEQLHTRLLRLATHLT